MPETHNAYPTSRVQIAPFARVMGMLASSCWILLVVLAVGCDDPDPTAELKRHFEDVKRETKKVDELLASVHDRESAEAIVPELKKHLKAQRAAGWEVAIIKRSIRTPSATFLLNQIEDFQSQRQETFAREMRRLKNIEGMDEVLKPVLMSGGEDTMPQFEKPAM